MEPDSSYLLPLENELADGLKRKTNEVSNNLSLTSLATVIEVLPDAILVWKDDGRIVLLNEQAERLFGYSKAELLDEKVEMLIPEWTLGSHESHRERYLQEGSMRPMRAGKQLCLRSDGRQVLVEISFSPIQLLLEDMKAVPPLWDVTEYREMEEKLGEACRTGKAAGTKVEIPLSPTGIAHGSYVIAAIRDVTNRQREQDDLVRLASIVNASMDGILTKTLDGIITSWNPACERMFGYSALEAVGKNIAMFYLPEEVEHEAAVLKRIALGEVITVREVVRVCKNGRKLWVSVSTNAQRDETDRVIGATTIYRDITTLKHAQQLFHGLLESAPDANIIVDSNGCIVLVNQQAVNLFGYERTVMLGQQVEMLIPPRFRDLHVGHRAAFLQSKSTRPMGAGKQLSAFRADGTEIPVDLSLGHLDDTEEGPLVTATIRDMTNRVETEKKLEAALLSAEAAVRAKSLFLASMSHELRTPLNAVLGMAQLLADSPLSSDQQDFVSTLRLSSEHLLGLISDLLDFSKIESTELVLLPEISDPIEIAEEALEIVRPRAQLRKLQLIFRPAKEIPHLMLDSSRLRQIFLNYLTNAIKYTDEGNIELDLDWKDIGDGLVELHLWVSDTGIGISLEDQDRLFKPFSQLKGGLEHAQGGVGLGLSICRHLAQLMGGKTWVQSEIGQGSTFHATVVAPPAVLPQDLVESTELPGKSVLVVDDQPANLFYLQRLLELWGMKVSGAIDGIAALEALKEQTFDLVIADEYMRNNISGLKTFVQELQSHWPSTSIPLVVTSSSGTAQTVSSGVQGIVLKPIRRKALRSTITQALSKMGARPRSTSATRLTPRRILVAEDNLVNQKVVTKLLSRLGQGATVVANGEEAVQAVAAGEFDLIFMDVNMPVQNGIEATREIRRCRFGCQPTIVAMTADTLPENIRCCRDAGMDDVITKPISMEELVRVIEQVDRELRRR